MKQILFSLAIIVLVWSELAGAAGRVQPIPAKQTFTVKDDAGQTIRCAESNGKKFYVLKQKGGYISGNQALKNLKSKIALSFGSARKKLKKQIGQLKQDIAARDPICGGQETKNPPMPPPIPTEVPNFPSNLEKLTRQLTETDVVTLVDKAGFGLGLDEERLISIGVQNGVDALVDEFMRTREEPEGLMTRVNDELDGVRGKVTSQTPTGQRQALLDLWIHTRNPYAERLAMALLGIWTVGGEVIEDETFRYANWDYITRLRTYSHDSTDLPQLALDITHDPLMILYLNNNSNKKGSINENYARELMELFTIGPVNLDQEPNYTETNLDGTGDIPTAARLLTGWSVKLDYSVNQLVSKFDVNQHDATARTMFIGKPWQFVAQTDEELVRGIFANHPSVKNYYAQEILKLYLTPKPPRGVVEAFGKILEENHFHLRPAMRSLFVSSAFYDTRFRNTVPSDPFTFAARAARTLRMSNAVNIGEIEHRTSDMGFSPNLPPSVFWYPQSAWSSSSALLEKANLISGILGDSTAQSAGSWKATLVLPSGDLTADQIIEFVVNRTHIGPLSDAQHQTFLSFMTTQLQYDGSYTPYKFDNTNPEHQRIKGLGLYFLALMSPKFQLL